MANWLKSINWKRIGVISAVLIGIVFAIGIMTGFYLNSDSGRKQFVQIANDALKSEQSTVHISEIYGDIFSNFQIPLVQLSDQKGIWLELRKLDLNWSPTLLLSGKAQISFLNIEEIEFIRPPETVEEDRDSEPFVMPSLPIDIEISQYSVGMLKISDALSDVASDFNINGKLKLTEDDGIIISSDVVNSGGQGDQILINISMPSNAANLNAEIMVNAPKDGFFNSFSDAIPNEDVSLEFNGSGPINNWSATFQSALADQNYLEGQLYHKENEWHLQSEFDVRPFVAQSIAELVGDKNTLDIKYFNNELAVSLISEIANVTVKGIDQYDFVIDIINPEPINQMIAPNYLGATKIDGEIIPFIDVPQLTLNLGNLVVGVKDTIETSVSGQLNLSMNDQVIDMTSNGMLNNIKGSALESVSGLLAEGIRWDITANFNQSTSDTELKQLSILNQNFEIAGAGIANIDSGSFNVDVIGEIEKLKNIAEGLTLNRQISGGLVLSSNIKSAGQNSPIETIHTLKAENIDLGNALLTELIGISPTLEVVLSRTDNGAITLSNALFDGAFVDFEAEANINENQEINNADFNLLFSDIENMKSFEGAALNGEIDIVGSLKGNINSPSLLIETGFKSLKIQSIELEELNAKLNVENVVDDLAGTFNLSALSNFGGINVNSNFAKDDQEFDILSLNILLGPYEASGAFKASNGKAIIGELDILTHEIDQNSIGLDGVINANLNLSEEQSAQKIEFKGEVSDFSMLLNENDLVTLNSINISTMAILHDEPILSLNALITQLKHPSIQSEEITAFISQEKDVYNYNVKLNGTDEMPYLFDFNGAFSNVNEDESLLLLSLSGSIDDTPIALDQNAEIKLKGEAFNLAPFNLTIGEGSITGNIETQENDVEAAVTFNKIDLSPLLVFAPELPLIGSLDGTVSFSSNSDSLINSFDYRLSDIRLKQQNVLNDYDAEIKGRGNITQQTAEFSGSIHFEDYFKSEYAAKLPIDINQETFEFVFPEDEDMQGKFTWNGDIAPIWPAFQLIDHDLMGQINADILLSGTYKTPDLNGVINLMGGRYENMQTGFVADDIEMEAAIQDRQISLSRFDASDGEEGTIKANADIKIDPDFSYNAQIDLIIDSAELLRQPELELKASTDLRFEKNTNDTSLSGDIKVENASIGAVEQGNVAIAELDVTEINLEGTEIAKNRQEDALGPIDLDLNLIVPNQLFVTSYGLDSEWEADLKITGSSEEPIVGGTANLIRGFFEFSGKRFELKRGNFAFPNDKSNDPVIEIAAEHAMNDMTANLRIYGQASNPKLELSSTPYLPENEVLARILFGTSVAELTAVEAVQLASAVYSLSNGGGQGMLGGIRRAIGVDRLSIDNDNGREYGTTITGGKYLTNNVYVEVSTAPATGETATSVEIDLTRNLSLVTRRTMDNDNNLSVRWFWDY